MFQKVKRFIDKFLEVVLVALISATIMAVGLIPTWIFIFIRGALSPEGFWQKFLFYGLGMYLLGGLQILMFIVAVIFVGVFLDGMLTKKGGRR